MESVAPVRTAEVYAIHAIDFTMALLRRDALRGEERVVVGQTTQDMVRVNRVSVVQGHEEIDGGVDPLQSVHPVGRAQVRIDSAVPLVDAHVPRRPRPARLRHHRDVGVDRDFVLLIRDRAEDLFLERRGIAEHPNRLIGVAGENDAIETLARPLRRLDLDPTLDATHRRDRRLESDAIAEVRGDRIDVPARTADDGQPLGTTADLQEAVIVEEPDERLQREALHVARARGPHRRAHREDVLVDEGLRVLPFLEVLPEGAFRRTLEVAIRRTVEPQDVSDHLPEARTEEIATLREESGEVRPVVLETIAVIAHRKAHVGIAPLHPELAQ